MKFALIGYGKMGRTIEQILIERGHQVTLRIDQNSTDSLRQVKPENVDVAIEFTSPESAYNNIITTINQGVPIVSGSTGWLDQWNKVVDQVKKTNGAFFYASNYSLGVNIFVKINKLLANMIDGRGYNQKIHEIHHIHKLDAPSGTAITLAEDLIKNISTKDKWVEGQSDDRTDLLISSERKDEVPGTHIITHTSEVDTITISHEAHSRKGFALGAVMAAEWLPGKHGVLGMDDYLNFKV